MTGIIDLLHTSRMENSSDASSQSSLDTYGTSHTSPEVSMEYHFADDSRFDQVSHETDHEAEVYSHLCVSL